MKLDGSLFSVVGDTGVEKIIGALVANIWKGKLRPFGTSLPNHPIEIEI
jgi:hypothetical protein